MSAQEFILILKENFIKNQPKASEILDDLTITAKSQLTLLQRVPEKKAREGKNVSRIESPRDTRKYPEEGTSLNYNAQSSSN